VAGPARVGPSTIGRETVQAAERLVRSLRVVEIARHHAADRFEWKHRLWLFTLAMMAFYFVMLSVWQSTHMAEAGTAASQVITFAAIMCAVLTLVLAVIETMNGYRLKAHHLEASALAIGDLLEELLLARPSDPETLLLYRRRYTDLLRSCPASHQRVDYLMAQMHLDPTYKGWSWVQGRYLLDVYGLCGAFLLGPPLILMVL